MKRTETLAESLQGVEKRARRVSTWETDEETEKQVGQCSEEGLPSRIGFLSIAG